MGLLSGAEDGFVIGPLGMPDRMDQPHPLIGQRAQRHARALPLLSLPLVVRQRPGLPRGLPGELVAGVAQRLATGVVLLSLAGPATLEGLQPRPGRFLPSL